MIKCTYKNKALSRRSWEFTLCVSKVKYRRARLKTHTKDGKELREKKERRKSLTKTPHPFISI